MICKSVYYRVYLIIVKDMYLIIFCKSFQLYLVIPRLILGYMQYYVILYYIFTINLLSDPLNNLDIYYSI